MEYDAAIDELYSLGQFSVKLGLERIREIMEKTGRPYTKYKVVHVAGTNGKGSTCAMIASILQDAGFRVGLYTSPHLIDFRERIQVDSKMIPKDNVVRLYRMIKDHAEGCTFFEITTAMALKYFEEMGVDYAVVETGLGGRLDATNVVDPEIAVITDIALDHVDHLGRSVEEIAAEKAKIIKGGRFVIRRDNLYRKIFEDEGTAVYADDAPDISVCRGYQKRNASLAAAVSCELGFSDHVSSGIMKTIWPGRMQKYGNIVLDCAHNADGARALVDSLDGEFVVILGVMKDKSYADMIKELERIASEFIFTRTQYSRAADPRLFADHVSKPFSISDNVSDAILQAGERRTLVTGSVYVVGDAFRSLGIRPFEEQ